MVRPLHGLSERLPPEYLRAFIHQIARSAFISVRAFHRNLVQARFIPLPSFSRCPPEHAEKLHVAGIEFAVAEAVDDLEHRLVNGRCRAGLAGR